MVGIWSNKTLECCLDCLFFTVFTCSAFCATEFFAGAWNGLKLKTITIDLPIVLVLIITFSRSVYEIQSGLSNGYLDSFSGIVFLCCWVDLYKINHLLSIF